MALQKRKEECESSVETIDQPVDVLAERRRRSSDTLSRRGEVPVKIVGVSTEWLLAWMERKVYRPPYLLRSLRGKHSDHKIPLGLLNQVIELVSSVSKHVPCTFLRRACVRLPALVCDTCRERILG